MTSESKKQLVLLAITGILAGAMAGISAPVFAQNGTSSMDMARAKEIGRRGSCQSNLKLIALSVFQYAQDHDGKMPPARSWINGVMPYFRNERTLNCPALQAPQRYGYAFNSNLAGQAQNSVSNPALTAMVYETTILKRNAFGSGTNRAYRHSGGANYAYADGHVKWVAKKSMAPGFKLKSSRASRAAPLQ